MSASRARSRLRRPVTLRVRLVITLLVLVAAGIGMVGGGSYGMLTSKLVDQVDGRLDDVARSAEHALATSPSPSAQVLAADFPRTDLGYLEVRRFDQAVAARWLSPGAPPAPPLPAVLQLDEHRGDLRGGVLYFTVAGPATSDPSRVGDDRRGEGEAEDPAVRWRARVSVLPEGGGRAGGFLVVAQPLAVVDELIGELREIHTGAGIVTMAILGVVGWWLVRRGMRPLDRIAHTARAIGAGELSRRVTPVDERSEVGQLGTALNAMLGRIETAFREKEASEERLRRFVADASHELRTPLTSIRGYAEMFRRGVRANPADLATAMRRIEEESARMGTLVDELLQLARLDGTVAAATEAPSGAPVDLAALAADALADATAVEPDRPLRYDGPPALLVPGDEAALRQVFGNLLDNVRQHTSPDAAAVVRVRRRERDGQPYARIEVADSGPGLAAGDQARVFERFYRTDRSRSRERGGSGLGLSIVEAVMSAHGGAAGVESVPGEGATFWFELPAGAAGA